MFLASIFGLVWFALIYSDHVHFDYQKMEDVHQNRSLLYNILAYNRQ